eukprot:scaffold101558_cov69-Phaeocystis_antarctica.AAC.1
MPTVQNELVPLARAASGRRLCFVQLWIGGWSGVHENPHGACILTTLVLTCPPCRARTTPQRPAPTAPPQPLRASCPRRHWARARAGDPFSLFSRDACDGRNGGEARGSTP